MSILDAVGRQVGEILLLEKLAIGTLPGAPPLPKPPVPPKPPAMPATNTQPLSSGSLPAGIGGGSLPLVAGGFKAPGGPATHMPAPSSSAASRTGLNASPVSRPAVARDPGGPLFNKPNPNDMPMGYNERTGSPFVNYDKLPPGDPRMAQSPGMQEHQQLLAQQQGGQAAASRALTSFQAGTRNVGPGGQQMAGPMQRAGMAAGASGATGAQGDTGAPGLNAVGRSAGGNLAEQDRMRMGGTSVNGPNVGNAGADRASQARMAQQPQAPVRPPISMTPTRQTTNGPNGKTEVPVNQYNPGGQTRFNSATNMQNQPKAMQDQAAGATTEAGRQAMKIQALHNNPAYQKYLAAAKAGQNPGAWMNVGPRGPEGRQKSPGNSAGLAGPAGSPGATDPAAAKPEPSATPPAVSGPAATSTKPPSVSGTGLSVGASGVPAPATSTASGSTSPAMAPTRDVSTLPKLSSLPGGRPSPDMTGNRALASSGAPVRKPAQSSEQRFVQSMGLAPQNADMPTGARFVPRQESFGSGATVFDDAASIPARARDAIATRNRSSGWTGQNRNVYRAPGMTPLSTPSAALPPST